MKLKINDGKWKLKKKALAKVPRELAREAYDYFRKKTPIRTGNARKRTRLRGETIHANYPYAAKLDGGWSKQARRGMTKPTLEYMEHRFHKMVRRRGRK